jgi:primosomal protein N' (replication factor Y) (superfamily II helicase)
VLSLDRAFTYDLPAELEAGVGSYVRVRFHGKLTRGWVLGPTGDIPSRMLPVMRIVSPVRFFDARMLELARWVAERYVAPLATVLGALSPPRVAGEEGERSAASSTSTAVASPRPTKQVLAGYLRGDDLRASIRHGHGAFVVRPAPEEEQEVAVEAVAACLAGGRRAIVLVPEATPLPATAAALRAAFGPRVGIFIGGDERARYRRWLELRNGRFDVVVGTRPGVFAPVADLGLVYVARESHPAHREDRSPYYHARDVALARARIERATCVLAAACPSGEAAALGIPDVAPRNRRWPKVEVVRPGPEGRARRLREALAQAHRAFVYAPTPGAGTARVCRACGAPAACAACGGLLRLQAGEVRCTVCASTGRCASCGAADFGIRRGGAERVEAWVASIATVPVARAGPPRLPNRGGEILIGGPEDVRDLGPGGLDLVAILDVDRTLRRPGLGARERALAIWMEAVGWTRASGRAIVQTEDPADPAVQALVRGNPDRFHARERARRDELGFPVGNPVFRVVGDARLAPELEAFGARTSLVSALGRRTVCLLALEPDQVPGFGSWMRELAARGIVERVEAEPHL